jgi:hypothetical protein
MYAKIGLNVNFWHALIDIDEQLCSQVQRAGCPWCCGVLDRGDYERKPRGIDAALREAFNTRCSTCCRACRKRVTPPSVRFLGRKVYVGAIVMLASIGALVCGAAIRTLARWHGWWTTVLPASTFWQAACARLIPTVTAETLPGGLLERFEQAQVGAGEQALVGALRFLQPVTTRVGEYFEGGHWKAQFAQKMPIDGNLRPLLRTDRIPATMT